MFWSWKRIQLKSAFSSEVTILTHNYVVVLAASAADGHGDDDDDDGVVDDVLRCIECQICIVEYNVFILLFSLKFAIASVDVCMCSFFSIHPGIFIGYGMMFLIP